jgi:uncharacterized membrane protein YdfJ with MMPL/SSD domain
MLKRHLKLLVFAIALLLIGSLLVALPTRHASAQKEQQQISESAARQIQSLIQEKESRTPTQRKIVSLLLYAAKQNRGEQLSREVRSLEVNVNADVSGLVPVDINATVTEAEEH